MGAEAASPKPQIQNSASLPSTLGLTLQFGSQPAEVASDVKKLRASAAGRLRPARPFQGRSSSMPLQLPPSGRGLRKARPERMQKQTRGAGLRGAKLRPAAPLRAQIQNSLRPAASIPLEASSQPSGRACFRAARDCSPPPGGGCGLPVLADRFCWQAFLSQSAAAARCAHSGAIKNELQHPMLIRFRAAACGGHAQSGPIGRELRASAAPGCGPPIAARSNRPAKCK